jgi:hypothetical protein
VALPFSVARFVLTVSSYPQLGLLPCRDIITIFGIHSNGGLAGLRKNDITIIGS